MGETAGQQLPPAGVRLAIDVGSVRIGIARSDPRAVLAVPEATLRRDDDPLAAIGRIADEWDAVVVYVGHPLTLSGESGSAADIAAAFAHQIAQARPDIPVHLVDERLSTVQAQRGLHAAGRDARSSRAVIDQAAAVVILEHALAAERASGTLAGRRVTVVASGHDVP